MQLSSLKSQKGLDGIMNAPQGSFENKLYFLVWPKQFCETHLFALHLWTNYYMVALEFGIFFLSCSLFYYGYMGAGITDLHISSPKKKKKSMHQVIPMQEARRRCIYSYRVRHVKLHQDYFQRFVLLRNTCVPKFYFST